MSDQHPLFEVGSFRPWLFHADAQEIATSILGWRASGMNARVVRGRKMRVLTGCFDEFAAALQFPLYFGENKDAFDECISDLEMLTPDAGFVIVITDPDQVLVEAGAELGWLVSSLQNAAEVWAAPIASGEWWDRPPVPFHVVLAGVGTSLALAEARWTAARAEVTHASAT